MATKKTTTKTGAAPRAKKVMKIEKGEAVVYSNKGKEVGAFKLPEVLFGVPLNRDLIHQVSTSMRLNARNTIANSKHRGEVRGGGKKPWKQKGTGRARHGSSRSPIWVGGGTTHGPRKEVVYTNKINKKMRARALASLLSKKYADGAVLFVDNFSFTGKTKDAGELMKALAKAINQPKLAGKQNAALVVLSEKNDMNERAFANLQGVVTEEARNINVVDILDKKFVIIENPETACATLMKKFTNTNA